MEASDSEMLDGILIHNRVFTNVFHQDVTRTIDSTFNKAIRKAGCKNCWSFPAVTYKPFGKVENKVIPDVLVVCAEEIRNEEGQLVKKEVFNEEGHLVETPVIVVEVLSSNTKNYDKSWKKVKYFQFGVKYYLLVNPTAKSVSIFVSNEKFFTEAITEESYTFVLLDNCRIKVNLMDFFPKFECYHFKKLPQI